jgi:hypothetical protein
MPKPPGTKHKGLINKEQADTIIAGKINAYLIANPPVGGLTLNQIKADTDIADVIIKKHAQGSDDQNLSGLQPKETGKGLYPDADALKLAGIEASANNYQHPTNHAASIITQDVSNRFVSDTEKGAWNGKEPGNSNIQTHVISAHAPAAAQKNSDITGPEIEAKLTGAITSHSHASGSDPFTKLVLLADKPTGANVTPVTLGLSFNYLANSQYAIDIYAIVAPAVATTGCGFMIDVSTVVTFVGTFVSHQLAVAGTLSGAGSVGDLAASSSGVSSGMVLTSVGNFVYGGGILITGVNPGTATFYFRSETTAVTTCKTGTIIRVMKLN